MNLSSDMLDYISDYGAKKTSTVFNFIALQ